MITDQLAKAPPTGGPGGRIGAMEHAFADGTVVEAFFQGGRTALTARSSPAAQAQPAVGASIGSSRADSVLVAATAWQMRSMWAGY